MRKQKEEKLKQEEAWLRSLPPEKQKREDEKRKKKEINKMMKGKTMKVMWSAMALNINLSIQRSN